MCGAVGGWRAVGGQLMLGCCCCSVAPATSPRCPSPCPLRSARCALQVGAIAIEIWTMDDGYFFDNVVVTNDAAEAAAVRAATWEPKSAVEVRRRAPWGGPWGRGWWGWAGAGGPGWKAHSGAAGCSGWPRADRQPTADRLPSTAHHRPYTTPAPPPAAKGGCRGGGEAQG